MLGAGISLQLNVMIEVNSQLEVGGNSRFVYFRGWGNEKRKEMPGCSSTLPNRGRLRLVGGVIFRRNSEPSETANCFILSIQQKVEAQPELCTPSLPFCGMVHAESDKRCWRRA
jgi:hypothetical protein